MTDKLTPEQRHKCMSHIRSKNTKPEMVVRKFLFSKGFRYRINVRNLPGTPDIVMRKYRTVIFINGCFWHGHEGCKYYVIPKSNSDFWIKKIQRNQERDMQERILLRQMGWHVIVIWECQVRPKTKDETLKRLEYTLNSIFLNNHRLLEKASYMQKEEENVMVAEDEEAYGQSDDKPADL